MGARQEAKPQTRMLGEVVSINQALRQIQPFQPGRADFLKVPGVTRAPKKAREVMTLDPILLVEVLSPSYAQDTWSSIPLCASVPCALEILIVHSTSVKVEILRRSVDQSWPLNPEVVIGLGQSELLQSIGLDLPPAEI